MDNNENKTPENKPVQQKVIKTYAADMARVIEEGTGGVIKEIIRGEEAQEQEKENLSPESHRNKIFMGVGALLLLTSLGLISYFYLNPESASISAPPQFIPLIFNDRTAFIETDSLKKDDISTKFLNEMSTSPVKPGGVEGIYLTYEKKVIGLRKFIELVKGSLVTGDTKILQDNFMLGFVHTPLTAENAPGKYFLMIIKMNSIPDIFNSLRDWEEKMFQDLHGFIGIPIRPETSYLLTKDFEDSIVENKNTRVLKDNDGKVVLMYIFADNNSVFFTNSEVAAHEVVLRLTQNQVQ